MMDYQFEICTNSAESCVAAQDGGATRVELCAAIPEGGTTPSYGEIKMARKLLDIRLHVIIRPRGGDFLYSPLEADIMEQDICMARELGADGVVFGCLTPEGGIDVPVMERLVQAARGLSVTFHRAFDYVPDPFLALDTLAQLGVNRILTSGQQPSALQGVSLLARLVKYAGNRIIVMPGCGINEDNIAEIAAETKAHEFHFSARESQISGMKVKNSTLSMGNNSDFDEYVRQVTTAARVKRTIQALRYSK